MIDKIKLNKKQLESFTIIFDEYIRLYNIWLRKSLKRSSDVNTTLIQKITPTFLDNSYLHCISNHCKERKKYLNSKVKFCRISNVRINFGQFIINELLILMIDLKNYYDFHDEIAYTDIKMMLNKDILTVQIDEDNLKIVKKISTNYKIKEII